MRVARRRLGKVALGLAAVIAVLLLAGLALLALSWRALGAAPTGERLGRMQRSPQHRGERFENPLPEHMGDAWTMMERFMSGNPHGSPQQPPPVHPRAADDFKAPADRLLVTWLGHSSLLVELDGARLLTDPVLSERTSPLPFMGPRRFHRPPLRVESLPEVDAVVLSHDHYDHLDLETIVALSHTVERFIVPLGVGAHLEYWGVPTAHITELDWWEQTTVGGLTLVCTPARHFSGRGLSDRNRTLWASWAMLGPSHRVFFSGDTAMFPGFAEIGRRYGPFDLSAIEVGAYDRDWPDVHLGPEQAVDAHQAIRARLLLPIHWGTFDLALHGWTEPVERLRVAAMAAGVTWMNPRVGERVDAAEPPRPVRWWPDLPWQSASEHPVISTGL